MHRFIIIEKCFYFGLFQGNLIKYKRIKELSVEKIIEKYQGFEGEPFSSFKVTENIELFKGIVAEYTEFKKLGTFLMLHVLSDPEKMPFSLKNQAVKLGYDVGFFNEGTPVYSSIFNEILFGYFDSLVAYKDRLNEHFLFPNKSIAEDYIRLHDEMSVQGKGVEDIVKMVVFEIWKHKE